MSTLFRLYLPHMAATTLLTNHSLLTFYSSKLQNNKIHRNSIPCCLSSSRRDSAGCSTHTYRLRKADRMTMSKDIRICAFRNSSDGDEGFQSLEQETFVDRSTDLSSGGVEASLNRSSKWVIACLFGAVIVSRHDPEAVWAIIGSITNSMLAFILKRILNEDRPFPTQKSDPGMPSSHAQSISYIAIFLIFSTVEWLGINELSLSIGGLTLAMATYFSWLRVSQKLHTTNQVVVGAIVGSTFSILWYATWKAVIFDAFVSTLWVQIVVLLLAAGLGLGFLVYVVLNWFKDA